MNDLRSETCQLRPRQSYSAHVPATPDSRGSHDAVIEMPRLSKKQRAEYLGAAPKKLARELRSFSRSARLLSSDQHRLITKYPRQWVGVYDGKICASAKSFNAVVSQLKRQGVPPSEAIIRYIDTSGRKLIL